MTHLSEHTELPLTSPENSESIFSKLIEAGKTIEPDFRITETNREYYRNLILYFAQREGCAWDLKKGLLISGKIGCGKTLSMKIMRQIFHKFGIINTRYVIRDFLAEKIPALVIDRYGRNSFHPDERGFLNKKRPINWCFDDFGLENINAKNYGNQQNVMEEIILDRYDMYREYDMRTFATTNLNPEMIEKNYGERVRDRLREMMNYIILDGETLRK